MYVICDIEWVSNLKYQPFPTQITAVKVSKRWNMISCFSSLIRPPMERKYSKNNVAFAAGEYSDFYSAKSAPEVFESLYQWLDEDDVLIWWYDKSDEIFRQFTSAFLPEQKQNESRILCDYILSFLDISDTDRMNQYVIAEKMLLDVSHYVKHVSMHDAIVICDVLKSIKYPQDALKYPSDTNGLLPEPIQRFSNFPYYYDPNKNMFHSNKCSKLIDYSVHAVGYPNFDKAISKGFKLCDCCKDEYYTALKIYNKRIIDKNRYSFVFSSESETYHTNDCRLALKSRNLKGARSLKVVLESGRKPCKVCNPPSTIEKARPQKENALKCDNFTKTGRIADCINVRTHLPFKANKDELRAVKRQKAAARERSDKLRDGLSQDELNNIYALTQPRYAFWAAKGHKHFHLRSCPTMKNLSHLRGFETYQDAIKARFLPCRKCKPTAKHDLKLSVPIYNQLRENESVRDLEEMCRSAGIECFTEDDRLHIVTSAGKWIVHADSIPIKLEHINLSRDPNETKYHEQHRVFLSFSDVFLYIKQHDLIEVISRQKPDCVTEYDYSL